MFKIKGSIRLFVQVSIGVLAAAIASYSMAASENEGHPESAGHGSALNPQATHYFSDEDLPKRTAPILELGGDFLGTGNIAPGFKIPTGAVWQPRLWVYGSFRSGFQSYDPGNGQDTVSEWANRLDLFANLQLTGSERVVLGLRPLNRGSDFTGYVDRGDGSVSVNELNGDIQHLFFEGDLAELFPGWDYDDSSKNDIGFSIGRQGIVFQDGFLINDNMDGIGLSKNNLIIPGVAWLTNFRSSFFYAWDGVNRVGGVEDDDAELFALFNQIETIHSTINVDIAYVSSDTRGDLFGYAIDATQRLGKYNTTFRLAGSEADEEGPLGDDGQLLFAEVSWTPTHSHNLVYANGFVEIDDFTQLARDPLSGGPLGRTGILYAGQGLGSFPSALSGDTGDAYGLALGYQLFLGGEYSARRQIVFEAGARWADADTGHDETGLGIRFQQALGRRLVVQVDGFLADRQGLDSNYGVRLELLLKL